MERHIGMLEAMPTRCSSVKKITDVFSSLSIDTPCKSLSTTRLRGRVKGKTLFPATASQGQSTKWSDEELQALTSFFMLYIDGKFWVAHKDYKFWCQAGIFIQQQVKTNHCHTGGCFTKWFLYISISFDRCIIQNKSYCQTCQTVCISSCC